MRWEGGAKVAVQIVINYEEGSEKTFAMGDGSTTSCTSCRSPIDGQRDLAVESMYEYGSAGRDLADAAGVRQRRDSRSPWFAAAVALERNPAVAEKLARRGDEAAGHGYRWSNHFEMTATRSVRRSSGRSSRSSRRRAARPLGWYCREMSVNTRELVVEEGGFLYDSDCLQR